MLVIRLARGGAKKQPFYHLVATHRRSPRDGRFIEKLGFFDPIARGKGTYLRMDLERIRHWFSQGAQASDRVKQLVRQFEAYGQAEIPASHHQARISERFDLRSKKKAARSLADEHAAAVLAAEEAKAQVVEEAKAQAEANVIGSLPG